MPSLRVAFQHQLNPPEFTEAILVELDGLEEERLKALNTWLSEKSHIIRDRRQTVTGHEGSLGAAPSPCL